jgi:hypothetical protein
MLNFQFYLFSFLSFKNFKLKYNLTFLASLKSKKVFINFRMRIEYKITQPLIYLRLLNNAVVDFRLLEF